MNYKAKRLLLGASTLLVTGVAFAKGRHVPLPDPTPAVQPVQAHDQVLQSDIHVVSQQVLDLQKQVKAEEQQSQTKAQELQKLMTTASNLRAQAITTATQRALAAKTHTSALTQAQYTAPPAVQSVSRASGSDDDGGHSKGGDD